MRYCLVRRYAGDSDLVFFTIGDLDFTDPEVLTRDAAFLVLTGAEVGRFPQLRVVQNRAE